jgi:excinuclease ABC subunit C
MGLIFERSKYPEVPGVYLMKDVSGSVIYVGKAASLRARLSQYFQQPGFGPKPDSIKTHVLVSQISSIDFVVVKDANEALILESNLIKSYQPKYNMALKDAKHYSYLAITAEEFPRLLLARKNSSGRFRIKAARFFGPFVEGAKREVSARYLRKLFRIRICRKLPKKECLQYHLGACDAPCIGKISAQDYGRNVSALCSVLGGNGEAKELMGSLRARMKEASDNLDYEKAAAVRDQMQSLRIFFERQRVEKVRRTDEDFLWFQRIGGMLHVQMLRSRNGVMGRVERHSVAVKEQEDPEASFCLQYYQPGSGTNADTPDAVDAAVSAGTGRPSPDALQSLALPDAIYTNLPAEAVVQLNSSLRSPVFRVPKGDKSKILEIAAGSLMYSEFDPAVLRLKTELGLQNPPLAIETFDISTLFGEESVGSMVRFVNGQPDKAGYRRFRIKGVEGQDDFAMMKEVVFRRYCRLMDEGGPFPDLVLVDGGAGQLHAAMDGMDEAGIRLPVAAIAKKEEEIYLPERLETLRMHKSDTALLLLQRCRDEAHRFAVGYHRLRRGKRMES